MPYYRIEKSCKDEVRSSGKWVLICLGILAGCLIIGGICFGLSAGESVFTENAEHTWTILDGIGLFIISIGIGVFGLSLLSLVGRLNHNRILNTHKPENGVYQGDSSWGFVQGYISAPLILIAIGLALFSLKILFHGIGNLLDGMPVLNISATEKRLWAEDQANNQAEKAEKSINEAYTRYKQEVSKKGIPIEIENEIGLKLVLIPSGSFTMGGTVGEDERPLHRVVISNDFYIGKYEITQAEYKAVMGKNPSSNMGELKPVTMVSWDDAVQFCNKLSKLTGNKYRLPTEAEWEYACRAGSDSRFYWGNDNNDSIVKEYAWYRKNEDIRTSSQSSKEGIQKVGLKKPNGFGLYDMSGNIEEWCKDTYIKDYYRISPQLNPFNNSPRQRKVLRGGYWWSYSSSLRSAERDSSLKYHSSGATGFRVVVEIK